MGLFHCTLWLIEHLVAWIAILVASAWLGHRFLQGIDFNSIVERTVFTLAVGLGAWALMFFGLGLVGLLYRGLIIGLTVAADVLAIAYVVRGRKGLQVSIRQNWKKYLSMRRAGVTVLLLVWSGLLLWPTFFPPFQWDATAHHLVLCREYLEHHRLIVVWGLPWPVLPAFNHMLFVWGMALKDDIIAQMVECSFLILGALGLFAWGKRANNTLMGIAAATFFLANPLLLWVGQSAYVDACLVSYTFLGMYALRVFWNQRAVRWWYLAMALIGMAVATKAPAFFFLAGAGALGLLAALHPLIKRKPTAGEQHKGNSAVGETAKPPFGWKAFAFGCAVALAVFIPWYTYFTYYTGNPFWSTFPQFSRGVWGSPAVVENLNNWYKNAAEPRTLVNFLRLPLDWIRYPPRFRAEVNLTLCPLIVIWPLAWIVAVWNRSVRWWTLWAVAFTLYWFSFAHQLRYWLPALPLAVVALHESIQWVLERISKAKILQTAVWLVLIIASAYWGGLYVLGVGNGLGRIPPTTSTAREEYLSWHLGYNAVNFLNNQAGANETVCMINASYWNYYIKSKVLDINAPLQAGKIPKFHWPEDQQWLEWLKAQDVNWIYVRHTDQLAFMNIPEYTSAVDSVWPGYQLVYADTVAWVFHSNTAKESASFDLSRSPLAMLQRFDLQEGHGERRTSGQLEKTNSKDDVSRTKL